MGTSVEEALSAKRKLLQADKSEQNVAQKLIEFCKLLMTTFRTKWTPPGPTLYFTQPKSWLEELLLIALRIAELLNSNQKHLSSVDIGTQFVAIIEFAAVQLKHIDLIIPVVDRLVQSLVCADLLIPLYIEAHYSTAVSLFLSAYHQNLRQSTKLCACLFLAQFPNYEAQIEPFLAELDPIYPIEIACIRAQFLIQNSAGHNRIQKAQEALALLQSVDAQHNHVLLYNQAYLSALSNKKEDALKLCKSAIDVNMYDSRTLLLFLRILRANGEFDLALELAHHARQIIDRYDKYILIEGLFIATDKSDSSMIDWFLQKLIKYWKHDADILEATVKQSLMIGKQQAASDFFSKWAEFDTQTPEFFYCYSQLCLHAKDLIEAEKHLMLAAKLNPDNAVYQSALAVAFFKNDKKDQALELARYLVLRDPNSIHSWMALAKISSGAEANAALQRGIALRQSTVNLRYLSLLLRSSNHI